MVYNCHHWIGGRQLNPAPSSEITELLHAWSAGDRDAYNRIVDTVYPELRKIAQRCLRGERPQHTIQTTALVHEAYLRLFDIQQIPWQDRAHFFAVSARIMRHILVDYARAGHSAKRGGGIRRVDFKEALVVSSGLGSELLRLDDALHELARFDSRKARVVEMRYFGGLTTNEIASVLSISPQSVSRDWNLAKAWLAREMTREKRNEPPTGRKAPELK
jgi:RNA polymerase sigma factor (TIGR02999 family)